MTDFQTRIDQFRKMASDDPSNELGHFSLGKALFEAGQDADAVASFDRVLALKPDYSKAYSLAAQAMLRLGRRDEAIERLTRGVQVAHGRGDKMPRDEMVQLLKDAGAAVPELQDSAAAVAVGEGQVLCRRCGKPGPKLPKQPFRNAFGQQVFENICAPCWEDAKKMGVKVINELRLPLNDPNANKLWEQHIREFLNLQA